MLAFIIYQVATSIAGMWIALIIGFFIYPAVCLCRLPILYGTYIHCAAFAFDYLKLNTNYYIMESLNKNGVSITQTPGEERYLQFYLGAFRGQIYYQYNYRQLNGNLFSTLAKTLEESRRQRGEWLKTQK